MPATPESLLADASRLAEEARLADAAGDAARAEELRRQVRVLAKAGMDLLNSLPEHEASEHDSIVTAAAAATGLKSPHVSTTMPSRDMETRTIAPEANAAKKKKISLKKTKHGSHPFVAATQADPRYGSPAGWAEKKGVPPSTVASWYSTGEAPRPIPKAWARDIEDDLKVPATRRVWRNGIGG